MEFAPVQIGSTGFPPPARPELELPQRPSTPLPEPARLKLDLPDPTPPSEGFGSGEVPGTEKKGREDLAETVERLNASMAQSRIHLSFNLYEGTDQLFVRVINTRTNDVIKTLPHEKILALRAKLNDLVGMLTDDLG